METEDMISLPHSPSGEDSGESDEFHEQSDVDLQQSNLAAENLGISGNAFRNEECTQSMELNQEIVRAEEGLMLRENLGDTDILVDAVRKEDEEVGTTEQGKLVVEGDVRNDESVFRMDAEVDMDLVDSPVRQVNIEVADTARVSGNLSNFGFRVNAQSQSDGTVIDSHTMNAGHISGVKRARITFDGQQPSVHVSYNSLTRASKRKLEELLRQWSEWHVQRGSSAQDLNEELESGEETYFPAICVDTEKSSAVSFWIESQTKQQQRNDFTPWDSDSVPLYDRGFALGLTSSDGPSNIEGGLEIVNEAARCFNCGSYNHSLKECPKPRDNVAVNNARKQHKSKRNQNAGSRNANRYYQSSSGGKFDGLKPGSLDAETRKLLGLGELDPPPWLNRMRELGYPPGYLDDEDQPSGITIFADGDVKDEQEDGEIVETENPDLPMKMAVNFPGINAPIPDDADERLWAAGPLSFDSFRNRSHRKSNRSSETIGRWHHYEQRGSRDFYDEGPPGVDPVFSPSSYPPRHGTYDSSPRGTCSSISRSHSDRGRKSPLVYDDLVNHSSSPYSSWNNRSPPQDDSSRLDKETDERWNPSQRDHSYRTNDEYDRYESGYNPHRGRW